MMGHRVCVHVQQAHVYPTVALDQFDIKLFHGTSVSLDICYVPMHNKYNGYCLTHSIVQYMRKCGTCLYIGIMYLDTIGA